MTDGIRHAKVLAERSESIDALMSILPRNSHIISSSLVRFQSASHVARTLCAIKIFLGELYAKPYR